MTHPNGYPSCAFSNLSAPSLRRRRARVRRRLRPRLVRRQLVLAQVVLLVVRHRALVAHVRLLLLVHGAHVATEGEYCVSHSYDKTELPFRH